MHSKNNEKFKIIDYNNTKFTLNASEHYLIKLDKKYKDKMLSITRESSTGSRYFNYKFIVLTSEKNVPSFGSSLLRDQIPYDISLDNLSNGLLEEENYYLYFEYH